MDLERFDPMLVGVADAFSKSLSPGTKGQYYAIFGSLTDDQWRKTCQTAKLECEMFPKISELLKISYRFAPPVKAFYRNEPTISFVCKCRNTWAWVSVTEFISNQSWRCPECHTSYDTAYLQQHRDGCLIDMSGDADRSSPILIAPTRVVETLEKEMLF